MKKTSQILSILLDNIDSIQDSGLCRCANCCSRKRLITNEEYLECMEYISNNRPNPFSSLEVLKHNLFNTVYYWNKGHKPPRVKWLKKHIKKLEKKGK